MSDQSILSAKSVEYKLVPDYPNYRVGDDGSVWSKYIYGGNGSTGHWKRIKGTTLVNHSKILTTYTRVSLCGGGGRRMMYLHRLILEIFVGQCPAGMECRHLNDIGTDNRLENLCWGTSVDNKADARRNGNIPLGSRRWNAQLDENKVTEIKRRLSKGEDVACLAAEFGVRRKVIRQIKNGLTWRHV